VYIAIEGIKGSGKSSALAQVQHALERMSVPHTLLRPYALSESTALSDRAFRLTARIWPDGAVARFYAWRSDRLAARVPRRCGLVIGDRSIITSYVTRWSDSNPSAAMDAVDRLERRIPLPDHVVLLNVPVAVAANRIQHRPQRCHGRRDEQVSRLLAAAQAYRTLASNPARFGIASVSWHVMDANRPPDRVARDVIDLVIRLVAPITLSSPSKGQTT
jgi:thymidylate kinase